VLPPPTPIPVSSGGGTHSRTATTALAVVEYARAAIAGPITAATAATVAAAVAAVADVLGAGLGTDAETVDFIKLHVPLPLCVALRDWYCAPSRFVDHCMVQRATALTGVVEVLLTEKNQPPECPLLMPVVRQIADHFTAIRASQRGCVALLRLLAAATPSTAFVDAFVGCITRELPDILFDAHGNYLVSNVLSNFAPRQDVVADSAVGAGTGGQTQLSRCRLFTLTAKDLPMRTDAVMRFAPFEAASASMRGVCVSDTTVPPFIPPRVKTSPTAGPFDNASKAASGGGSKGRNNHHHSQPPGTNAHSRTPGGQLELVTATVWETFTATLLSMLADRVRICGLHRAASHVLELALRRLAVYRSPHHATLLRAFVGFSPRGGPVMPLEDTAVPLCQSRCGHHCVTAALDVLLQMTTAAAVSPGAASPICQNVVSNGAAFDPLLYHPPHACGDTQPIPQLQQQQRWQTEPSVEPRTVIAVPLLPDSPTVTSVLFPNGRGRASSPMLMTQHHNDTAAQQREQLLALLVPRYQQLQMLLMAMPPPVGRPSFMDVLAPRLDALSRVWRGGSAAAPAAQHRLTIHASH
jgi:hypothetical protein